ncbi:MAG: DNA polymerase III subunit [Phycisphaerae bacterium]|nr:DNA polymerase III subunit [Phycisphaerae bacterium]
MPIFDVQHQQRAQSILLRAFAGERLPHAYIFHGPPGVGKRMLADRLAMLLLCPNRRAVAPPPAEADAWADVPCVDACGECDDCHMLAAGTHPDLHVIDRSLRNFHPDPAVRARKGVDLGIDVIRHFLIAAAGKRPMRDRAKIFVVEEADRMTNEAQNAMLKTLEEPPPTTFVILLATSLDRLLPTTRSRCQPVPLAALPIAFTEQKLCELRPDVPAENLAYLARLAAGRLGAALQYADDGLCERKRSLGEGLAALGPDTIGGFVKTVSEQVEQYAKELAKRQETRISDTEANRVALRALLAAIAAFFADALRKASGTDILPINLDQPHVIDVLIRRHSPRGLTQAIREVVTAESNIDRNANVQLVLESLATRLTHG